jgi:secreted trypsin-like serine protease
MQSSCDAVDPRIVGGTPAAFGDFPFYASTILPSLCGGTLIHEDIILTAAHCGDAFLDGVHIGGVLVNGMDAVEVVSVDQEFPHMDYDPTTTINDIMLVKLTAPVTSPLVSLNFDPTVPAEGDVVTVIGFGHTMFNGSVSDILLMVDVDVYSDEFCELPDPNYDPPTMICADDVLFIFGVLEL